MAVFDIKIETYDDNKIYDAARSIILAYENADIHEAQVIKRKKAALTVIGFNPDNESSFVEFMPKFIAMITWFKKKNVINAEKLFVPINTDSKTVLFIISVDGCMADDFLTEAHKEFLREKFKMAA